MSGFLLARRKKKKKKKRRRQGEAEEEEEEVAFSIMQLAARALFHGWRREACGDPLPLLHCPPSPLVRLLGYLEEGERFSAA